MLISKFDTTDIEKKIADFESKHGISLPEQYRGFMLKYNGGDTPETDFKCKRTSSDVRAFFGIGCDDYYSFENLFEKVLAWSDPLPKYIKKGFLPIAEDSYGNYILIGISEENIGQIFFADHEKGGRRKLLTDDFAGFIRSCTTGEIDLSDIETPEAKEQRMIAEGKGDRINDFVRKIWKDNYELYSNLHPEEVVL